MNYHTKYVVRLTEEERDELQGVVRRGKVAAAKRARAQVLFKADAGPDGSGPTDAQVVEALEVSTRSVNRVRKAYVEGGLQAALERQPRRKLDGAAEAQRITLACLSAPAGQARWTLQLLRDKLVELHVVESISRKCVRQTLKNDLKPWLKRHWALLKADDPDFVCALEDVPKVCQRPPDEQRPHRRLGVASQRSPSSRRPAIPHPRRPHQTQTWSFANGRVEASSVDASPYSSMRRSNED